MSTRSSTPIAFPIAGPRDLLEKAKREIDRLEETAAGFWGEPDPVAVADLDDQRCLERVARDRLDRLSASERREVHRAAADEEARQEAH